MKINIYKLVKETRKNSNGYSGVPILETIKKCTTFNECKCIWEDAEYWHEGTDTLEETIKSWRIMKSKAKSFGHYEWLLERAYHNGLDDEWKIAMKIINKMAKTFNNYKFIWVMEFVNHPKEDIRNWSDIKKFLTKISKLAVTPRQKAWVKKNVR